MVGHDVVVRVMGEIVSRVQESVGLMGLGSDELAVVEGARELLLEDGRSLAERSVMRAVVEDDVVGGAGNARAYAVARLNRVIASGC